LGRAACAPTTRKKKKKRQRKRLRQGQISAKAGGIKEKRTGKEESHVSTHSKPKDRAANHSKRERGLHEEKHVARPVKKKLDASPSNNHSLLPRKVSFRDRTVAEEREG